MTPFPFSDYTEAIKSLFCNYFGRKGSNCSVKLYFTAKGNTLRIRFCTELPKSVCYHHFSAISY